MNKDVIYIDVEDDITAIIGKVKDAKEKIVALVPPKRIGVLQSAVNLRLLTRAAEQNDKRLVLITSNSALVALAAAAKVPVAKTLQSKPELAEISALDVDDGEDVIDGSQLPVGELMKTAGPGASAGLVSSSPVEDLISENPMDDTKRATPPAPGQMPPKPKSKSGVKVPNFNKFRKKLVFIIGGGVLLIGFLIWAIFFAPHATVVITARTSDSSVNDKVTLSPTTSTNVSSKAIKLTTEEVKKDVSVDFDATGTKEVGEKATGKMSLSRTSVSSSPISVPAGTSFSSGTITFVSTESAVLAGTTVGPGGIVQDSATVSVQAANIGDEYNLSARSYQSSVGGFSATGTDMSGGSKRQAKVVSSDDVQKAVDQLTQQNSDATKKQLAKQLDDTTVKIIDSTFKSAQSNVAPSPGVNQEAASGKAKLTASITYSLSGVEKSAYGKYLDDYFANQVKEQEDQRVYDNGANKVTFTNVAAAEGGFTANIVANAKIGPKINDDEIKNLAKGKRYGDIQASIEAIQGVDDVDIKFWPFWVSSVPNDTKKISIEFKLNEDK
jgi:hypothetical protein